MILTPETSGPIAFLTAPDLLRDLLVRKATGQLVAYRDEIVKKVFFKNGFILYATSNLPADRLGDVLMARGMITREQYEESARQVLATGRKQGTVLVQIAALTPKDLFRGLIAQVREIVISLFGWDSGTWRFLEGLPPQEEIIGLHLHPAGLIFEGLLRIAADARWTGLTNLRQLRLSAASDCPFLVEELDLPDPARQLYALVEQGRPPEDLARLAGVDDRTAAALMHGLALLGLVALRRLPAAQPAAPAPTHAPAQAPAAAPASAETVQLRAKVATLARQLATLSHYQLLGLTPASDQDTIKRTYIALAKEYHPDRFFRPEFEDLQETVNAIFMHINEAFTTLNNPKSRADYDRDVLRLNAPPARVREAAQDSALAKGQFTKGMDLLSAGDVWSAIQALRWAVNLAPQNARYHTWLGVALTRTKKRLHEAEEHCKTAIVLDYNNAQYYVHLGQVYKTGHLYDKAKQQFEKALRLDPKHVGALKEIRELEDPGPHKGPHERIFGR